MAADKMKFIPELYAPVEATQSLKIEATDLISWDLTSRQTCDLELLMNGGFYPLKGFLGKKDYINVVENMRLADGTLWPIPITLDVSKNFSDELKTGQKIALRDQEGVILATLEISDIYIPNKEKEAKNVYGEDDQAHPAVNYLYNTVFIKVEKTTTDNVWYGVRKEGRKVSN